MRAGWMRPSWSSFSSVSRAISRRTPSKPDSSTAPGVSSMMKSIPVSVSRARMLRPSRPMMRPFSSSDLSSTTDTVVSTAWLEATRCMTAARMLRARRSASCRVSSSTWRISRALSWRSSSSSSRISSCLAWPALRPATRSSSRSWRALASLSSSRRVLEVALAVVERALALVELWAWRSIEPSLARRRSSSRASSERRARSSSSSAASCPSAPVRRPPGRARPSGRSGVTTVAGATPAARGPLHQQRHGHGDRRRHQRRQHDLHLVSPLSRRVRAGLVSRSPSGSARRRETPVPTS